MSTLHSAACWANTLEFSYSQLMIMLLAKCNWMLSAICIRHRLGVTTCRNQTEKQTKFSGKQKIWWDFKENYY